MLLAIDIGNTNINLGVFDGDNLKMTWQLATRMHHTADEYGISLVALLRQRRLSASKISAAVLCSVVPPLVPVFEDMCRKCVETSPLIVEAGVKTGVRICLDNPRELGPDRVANAAAAYHLYGGPAIVIDLGTATTFDVVSKEGDYLGGAIAPGVAVASEALFTRTAALPRIELARPKHAIGRNTVSAMQSGIVFGYAALIEGMVNRLKKELGNKARIIATGGYARLFAKEIASIEIVNPDLTLVGLRLIYEMNSCLKGENEEN